MAYPGKGRASGRVGGRTRKIGEIANDLPLIACGQIGWKGKKANMEIGETSVIITRTAKPKRKNKSTGRRVKVQPGVALTIRLVAVRLPNIGFHFVDKAYHAHKMSEVKYPHSTSINPCRFSLHGGLFVRQAGYPLDDLSIYLFLYPSFRPLSVAACNGKTWDLNIAKINYHVCTGY
ncbi:hypothetical protein [Candidatus Regiella insecticola]|uniref:hypothetical protein n=1 Tax=Candidatus Regiella insecticola TaxID=138073 RepID=UPI001145D008|nr:hypothetical protein [Candidatus Regiella insecticola]